MKKPFNFQRRGIVEGFFGPLWSMTHRKALLAFAAARGVNTYLYAPKDDPYHRERWQRPYPQKQWRALLTLIRQAEKYRIDFVYGFHPGQELCFSDDNPVRILMRKAQRFHDAGVRTFAVLFDDIPSSLAHRQDRRRFNDSLAAAEGTWLAKIQSQQPASWQDVEWWICPSYYSPDPLLARIFGKFEERFLETLAHHLPPDVACLWTGPRVVPKTISLAHMQSVAELVKHPLILWDNYPVNDLSMSDELHIGPLTGRDPFLAKTVYGYLSNPLLQEALSLVPLATCFDYAENPVKYQPEASWIRAIDERFGAGTLGYWRTIRKFCEASQRVKKSKRLLRLPGNERARLKAACDYIRGHQAEPWAREIEPWRELMLKALP
jgi:hyaluronoglucosaminidase